MHLPANTIGNLRNMVERYELNERGITGDVYAEKMKNIDGDGILTMLIRDDTKLLTFLRECDKPTVNLEGRILTTAYPRVPSDTRKAAEMAFLAALSCTPRDYRQTWRQRDGKSPAAGFVNG